MSNLAKNTSQALVNTCVTDDDCDTHTLKHVSRGERKRGQVKKDKRRQHLPLVDLIEKFQKIKEERFKPNEQIQISQPAKASSLETLPVHKKQMHTSGSEGMSKYVTTDGRKLSLPSLPHPTVLLTEQLVSDGCHVEVNITDATHSYRRHSMSHVVGECAKQNIHKLSKLNARKLTKLNKSVAQNLNKQSNEDSDTILM